MSGRMAGPNNRQQQDQTQKPEQKQDTTLNDQNIQGNREEARQQITRRINMDQKGGQLLQSGELSKRPNDFGRDAIFDPARQGSLRTEHLALQMLLPLCQKNDNGDFELKPIPEAKQLFEQFKNPANVRSYLINSEATAAELAKTFPGLEQPLKDNVPFFVDKANGRLTVNPKSSIYYLVAKEVESGTKASDSTLRKDMDKLLSSALPASLGGSAGMETKAYELIRADVERAKLASELEKSHSPKETAKIKDMLQDAFEKQKRLEHRTAMLLDSPQAREDFKEVQGINIVALRTAAAAQGTSTQTNQKVIENAGQFLKSEPTPQMKAPPATPATETKVVTDPSAFIKGGASQTTPTTPVTAAPPNTQMKAPPAPQATETKVVADPSSFIKGGTNQAATTTPVTSSPQSNQKVVQDPSQFIKGDAAPQMKSPPSATQGAPEGTGAVQPQATRRMNMEQKGAELLQSGQLSNRPNDFGRDAFLDPSRQGSLRTEHVALQMLLPLCQKNEKGQFLLAPIPEAQGLFNEFKNPALVRSYLIKPQETAAELTKAFPQFGDVLNANVPFFVDKANGTITVNEKSSIYYLVGLEVASRTKASDSQLRKDMDKLLSSPLPASLGGSAGMETKAYELIRADLERKALVGAMSAAPSQKELNRLQDSLERQKRVELKISKLMDSPQANQDFKEVQGTSALGQQRIATTRPTPEIATKSTPRVVEPSPEVMKGGTPLPGPATPAASTSTPAQPSVDTPRDPLLTSPFRFEAPSVKDPSPRQESFNVSYNGEPLQTISAQVTPPPLQPPKAQPISPQPAPAQNRNVVTFTSTVVNSVYDAAGRTLTPDRSTVPQVGDRKSGPPSDGEALRMISNAVQELKNRNGGNIAPGQTVTITVEGPRGPSTFPIDISRVPAPGQISLTSLQNATRNAGIKNAIDAMYDNLKISVERTSPSDITITYPKGVSVTLGDLAKPAPAPNAGPQPANEPAKQAAPQAQPAPANPPQPAANPEVNTDLQAMKARLDALEKQNEELRTELKKYTSGTPTTEPKPAQPAPQPSTPAASPAPTPSSPPDLKAIAAQVQNGIGTFADNEEAMRAPLIKLSAEDLVQLGNQVVRQEKNRGGTVIREVSLKEEVLKNLNGEQRKEFEARFDGNHLLADAYVVSYELSRVNVGNIARKDLHEALLRVKSSLGENATGEGALGYIKDYTDLGQNFNSGNIQANIRNMDSDFLKELRSNNPTTKVDKPRSIVVPTTATTSPAVDDEVTTKVKNKFLEVEQFAKMDATAYNSLMDDLITSARERLKSTSSPITGDNLIEAVKKEMTDRQKALFDLKIEE